MIGRAWIADVNTTNLRIVVSLALFALYVLGTMALSAVGRAPGGEVLYTLGTALLVAMGLDVAQFSVKRNTHIVTPPEVMATDAAVPAAAVAGVSTTTPTGSLGLPPAVSAALASTTPAPRPATSERDEP